MEDRHGTSRTYEIVGRIGGDFIRAYARPGARMAAAIGHNLLAAWSSRGAIRKKLLRPLNRALGRIMRSPVAKEPMEPATLPADIARLLTELCAAGNRQHARSDRGANPRAGEKIRAFLENMDFGELMDAARAAEPRAYEAIEAFNRELWRYPAKVVSIVATLVALVNTARKRCKTGQALDHEPGAGSHGRHLSLDPQGPQGEGSRHLGCDSERDRAQVPDRQPTALTRG